MSNQVSGSNPNNDDFDLGHLFSLIRRAFNKLGDRLFMGYAYLYRNAKWLIGLAIIGVIGSYLLKTFVTETKKIDVIVSPSIDNKTFLTDAILEISNSLEAKDEVFFQSIGMDEFSFEGVKVEIVPIRTSGTKNDQLIELLKEFDNSTISRFLEQELRERSTLDHRISFTYNEKVDGEKLAQNIITYLNSNTFYQELQAVSVENASNRIKRNDSLISQIDQLINNYTQKMMLESQSVEGRLVLENEEPLNVPDLLNLKNVLIKENESKRLELARNQSALQVKHFGKPYVAKKFLFKWSILALPLILIGLFIVVSWIGRLNRRVREME